MYKVEKYSTNIIGLLALIGLYFTSYYNYLLFHSLAEIFSIIIASAAFMIVYKAKEYTQNPYLYFIGIAYLFVGFLDLLHTLAYKGMNIFTDYDYYANQLWIATRYLESLTLLIAFSFFYLKKRVNFNRIFLTYTLITGGIICSIFYMKVFPVCFIEGIGLTSFKIISEYIICIILVFSIIALYINKENFDDKIRKYVFWSIIFTIASEICFTLYISNYGLANLIGHYFKIFAFFLIYKAIIETSINDPFDLIFRELKSKEKELEKQAVVDEMTGTFNRRAALNLLGKIIKQSQLASSPLTLCFIDIDRLKEMNDTYGHTFGDELILAVADVLKSSIRHSDYVCRMGGDEFLVIINSDVKDAEVIIQRAKEKLSHYIFDIAKEYRADFSYGFSEYEFGKEVDIENLIKVADENMFKNKSLKKSSER